MALLATRGTVYPRDFTAETLEDEQVISFAKKIEIGVNEELDRGIPAASGAPGHRLRLHRDGLAGTARSIYPLGDFPGAAQRRPALRQVQRSDRGLAWPGSGPAVVGCDLRARPLRRRQGAHRATRPVPRVRYPSQRSSAEIRHDGELERQGRPSGTPAVPAAAGRVSRGTRRVLSVCGAADRGGRLSCRLLRPGSVRRPRSRATPTWPAHPDRDGQPRPLHRAALERSGHRRRRHRLRRGDQRGAHVAGIRGCGYRGAAHGGPGLAEALRSRGRQGGHSGRRDGREDRRHGERAAGTTIS